MRSDTGGPMKWLALGTIRLYQRLISPHKGFGCAYRLHTGCAGCSTLGYRAIRRWGVCIGLGVLGRRLDRCGEACRQHREGLNRRLAAQAGVCDLSCDLPCDVDCSHGLPKGPSHCASSACDFANCSACDCGDWRRRRKTDGRGKWVRIPPSRSRRPAA